MSRRLPVVVAAARVPRPAMPRSPHARTLALLASVLVVGGCRDSHAEAPPVADAAIPVATATVASGTRVAVIAATGTTAGREEVPLAFTIGGIVAHVDVRAGESVRAGQRLAALEPTEIAAQRSTSDEGVAKASRDLARVEQLYRDSVATLEQLQDARTALAVARNASRVARFNAEHAIIRAPGAGVILARAADPGQLVGAGRPVLVLRRAGTGMVVRAALADREVVRVRPGDSAAVTLDAMPGARFGGRVLRRAAAADAASGAYEVEVALGADAATLPSGLVAQVTIVPGREVAATPARPLVPVEALVDADADSAAVFVLAPDGRTVTRRTIRLTDVAESLHGARLPVLAGLRGGEQVVVGNTARLVDGARVTVATPATAAGDAPAWRTTP